MPTAARVALLASLLSGCVVYPTTNVYFEPQAADGVLRQSVACGFRTKDELERQVDGLRLSAVAHIESNGAFRVRLIFDAQGRPMVLKQELFELTDASNGKSIPISNIQATSRQYRTVKSFGVTEDVRAIWVTMTPTVSASAVAGFVLTMPENTVVVAGQTIRISPITFKKVEAQDVYHGSINC